MFKVRLVKKKRTNIGTENVTEPKFHYLLNVIPENNKEMQDTRVKILLNDSNGIIDDCTHGSYSIHNRTS